MKDDTAKAAGPDAPGRRRTLLHPRLDERGKALEAVPTVLARWDEFARRLLAIGMIDDSDEPLPGGDGAEA